MKKKFLNAGVILLFCGYLCMTCSAPELRLPPYDEIAEV